MEAKGLGDPSRGACGAHGGADCRGAAGPALRVSVPLFASALDYRSIHRICDAHGFALDHIPKYDMLFTTTTSTRAHKIKNRLTNARTANAPSRRAAVPSSIDGLPTTRYVTPVTAPRGPPGPSRLKIRLARPACSLLQRTTPRPAHDRRSHVHPASAPASPGDCTGAPGHRHARGSDVPRRVATPRLDLAELGIICLRPPWRWQRRRCWQRRGAAFDALGVRHAQFLGDGTERPADRIHLAVEPADR